MECLLLISFLILISMIIGVKKILWTLLKMFDNNWGYSTPLQFRFKVGDRVKISTHSDLIYNTPATVIEFGRYDYLIEDDNGERHIVYQFEIYSD
jgi:hypothetical protein